MSKFKITINGNEATLDFGEETQADGSMIHAQLPISVTHLRVRGHKVITLGEHDVAHSTVGKGFLWGCYNLTSVDLTHLEKNFPDIRNRFPYLPHTPTLKENKMIYKEELNRELFIACRSGLVNAASMLIEAGADVNYVAQNMVGRGEEKKWTCLHEAVAMSRPEIVQLLLKHGALTVKDENDRTPLDIAIYSQDKDIIRILMKHEG